MSLYNKLSDNFNRHDGFLTNYTTSSITPFSNSAHYNLRSFNTTNVVAPWTMNDMRFWNTFHFSGMTMDDFSLGRSVVGAQFRRHTMDDLSVAGTGSTTYYTMSQLNGLSMAEIDFAVVSSGNEDWPTADANVVVGKDAAYRYGNTIRVTLTGGAGAKTVSSFYSDDILTDLTGAATINLTLRAFPAQAAGVHLDLANSFIDFSGDQDFTPAVTDSIAFNASQNSLTAGGDLNFQVNRTLLTHVDKTNIKAIRFRLVALGAGTMTFIAQSMRIIPSGWAYSVNDVDTKRQNLGRAVPLAGGADPDVTGWQIMFKETRPEDVTFYVRFNSGHNPTPSNDNILAVYWRWKDTSNYSAVQLNARSTQSRLRIRDVIGGVDTNVVQTPILSNALQDETDYILVVEAQNSLMRASIYKAFGVFLGALVYTTDWQPTTRQGRGYTGFGLEPYNYDFTMDYISATAAKFATFESAIFPSRTPVIGARLNTSTTDNVDVLSGSTIIAQGDAVISSASIGKPSPSTQVVRTGTDWSGGLVQSQSSVLGDPSQILIQGDIYPVGTVRGIYRVALADNNGSVGFIADVQGLLPNQWNSFEIPLDSDMVPSDYRLYVQQVGFYPDTFYIDNLKLAHLAITWDLSANGGTNWQPLLHAVNKPFGGVRFANAGSQLKVRARANSDHVWVQGYQLIPTYGLPGQFTSGYGMGRYGMGSYGG